MRCCIDTALIRSICSFSAAAARRTHERNQHTTGTVACPVATTVLWQATLGYLRPSRCPNDPQSPRTEPCPRMASTARGSPMQAHRHGVSSGSGEMAMVLTGSPAPIILVVSSLLLRSYLKMPAGCRWLGDQGTYPATRRRKRG